MTHRRWQTIVPLVGALCVSSAAADSADARCDIDPRGSDHTDKMIPCVFSQRQGFVTIRRDDGVMHELEPVGDAPGNSSSVPLPPPRRCARRDAGDRAGPTV